MKKSIRTLLPSMGVAVAFTLLWSSQSTAVGFSNRHLRGDYAFTAQTCCVLGRFTADGAGHFSGSLTLAGGGDVHHESMDCDYNVAPDGTGTMNCTTVKLDGPGIGDTATGTNEFVLLNRGEEVFVMNNEPGGEVEGLVTIAKRQ
jgi:hypothetical protein